MSLWAKLFGGPKPKPQIVMVSVKPAVPTVALGSRGIAPEVRSSLAEDIRSIPELRPQDFDCVYEAALKAVSRCGAQHLIAQALASLEISELDRRRAGELSIMLLRRAQVIMDRDRRVAIGITDATWSYSGVPCFMGNKPTADQKRMDAAHRKTDGKRFKVQKGMLIDGQRTWPGWDAGCKCVSKAVIPRLSKR